MSVTTSPKRRRILVRVKDKFQVTIPSALTKQTGLSVGDYLEIGVQGTNKILMQPKQMVGDEYIQRAIEAGLRDIEAGRVSPAFNNMEEFKEYIRKEKS